MVVEEPNITATGTVTNAATVYIKNAPSEGSNNYALWVDAGNVKIDGDLTVDGTLSATATFDLGDDDKIEFGAGDDYWFIYDSTNTAFELNSTNISGGY